MIHVIHEPWSINQVWWLVIRCSKFWDNFTFSMIPARVVELVGQMNRNGDHKFKVPLHVCSAKLVIWDLLSVVYLFSVVLWPIKLKRRLSYTHLNSETWWLRASSSTTKNHIYFNDITIRSIPSYTTRFDPLYIFLPIITLSIKKHNLYDLSNLRVHWSMAEVKNRCSSYWLRALASWQILT